MAAQFRAGWQSGEPRVDLVTDDLLDAVAVAGDEDTCRAGLRRLAAAGLDTAVLTDDMSRAELAAAVTAVRTV